MTSFCQLIRDRKPERVLQPEHVNFLLDDNTHEIWAGLTIKERCMHFSVRFPGKVISPTKFYRFCKEHRIRRKSVKITKNVPPADKHKKLA